MHAFDCIRGGGGQRHTGRCLNGDTLLAARSLHSCVIKPKPESETTFSLTQNQARKNHRALGQNPPNISVASETRKTEPHTSEIRKKYRPEMEMRAISSLFW